MNFSHLQQSWQQQAAPATTASPATETTLLLAETERLHRYGRQRNQLSTVMLLLALACLLVPRMIDFQELKFLQRAGLGILAATLLGFLAAMWWGTTLRQATQPGLDSRAYVQASLQVFRFRRQALVWLAMPYALGLGVGLLLLNWSRLHVAGPATWWRIAAWLLVLIGAVLIGRRVGLRRYEREFGPTERALTRWQQELLAES